MCSPSTSTERLRGGGLEGGGSVVAVQVHYIEKNYGIVNKDFRIVLKVGPSLMTRSRVTCVSPQVHHCIYPSWAWPFGKLMGILSTRYNKLFRSLFLYTINPKVRRESLPRPAGLTAQQGLFNRFAAWNVVFWTKVARAVVHQIEEKVGYRSGGRKGEDRATRSCGSRVHLATASSTTCATSTPTTTARASLTASSRLLPDLTSIVVMTWRAAERRLPLQGALHLPACLLVRVGGDQQLQRHVPSLEVCLVCSLHLAHRPPLLRTSPIDYAMIFGGYALSIYTTFQNRQLGVDGTYFGIELGYVKVRRGTVEGGSGRRKKSGTEARAEGLLSLQASKHYVQKFPYGVIPHPMILSQCVAMIGFMRAEAFRASWPYLVPAHVCLYLVHMLQEHFDIHKNRASKSAPLKSA
eukprot:768765-Hanusia_phi.AAC.4